ncbi:ATP-binding cassette domain-containing protein [Solihabitans fulvus]|uniref:ATP-binding cassette domain-containing protein n=1 Tax=Solihabitans fulvus TaxID=1892852 RepID=A0A5B2XDP9_9PSEU|nr:ATP-binding cassette domain-containing protein [Solihabitans fulvus]KAA2261284.1 ATP-binding cassette domain-containing protein [Solihabitans fulvus]
MDAVWYGPFARLADWFQGLRDGRQGIPLVVEPAATPSRGGEVTISGLVSTPHREVLIRRAHEAFGLEHLRHEAAWADDVTRLARQMAQREQAALVLTTANHRLAEASTALSESELVARRPGEDSRGEPLIVLRRSREHARRRLAAERTVESAQTAVDRLDVEIIAGRESIDRRLTVLETRLRRIHEHSHRRLAAYRRRLVRSHRHGPLVSRAMDVLNPLMPGTVRPFGQRVPDVPTPPPTPTPVPSTPVLPDGEVFELRDSLLIGSSPDADIFIKGYRVAERHAVVERRGGHVTLKDLGHGDGTYQSGRPVLRTQLEPESSFDIADYRFVLSKDSRTISCTSLGACDLVVHLLSAESRAGKKIEPRLTRMSFVQREQKVLAILGPSGAGKSSLFAAVLGELETSSGDLYFRGLDVRTHLDQLRPSLGVVPQEDSLHRALTVRQLLGFADRLRRPSDRAPSRADPIAGVCEDLDITRCLDKPVEKLSGGQRKRVSIALELLAKPTLLMLDEPTSGLDPGMDRDVMMVLRAVAQRDCTVIVVTHATEHLHLADQVLVVAPGGCPVYCGPQPDLLPTLGFETYADLMKSLQKPDETAEKKSDPRVEEYANGEAARTAGQLAERIANTSVSQDIPERSRSARTAFLHQLPILVARQVTLVLPVLSARHVKDDGHVRKAALSSAMPFVIACMSAILAAAVTGEAGLGGGTVSTAGPTALSILITLSVLTGQALTYSNLVEERPVLVREHRTGMLTTSVVLAKWLVFTVVVLVQTALATLTFVLIRPGPVYAVTGLAPDVELFVDLSCTSVAAMSMGLLISAACRQLKEAVTVTSLMVIAQVALNGVTTSLSSGSWIVGALAGLLPARWGLAAAASTVDIGVIAPRSPTTHPDDLWWHTTRHWLLDVGVVGLLSVAFVGLAIVVLNRRLHATR